MSNLRRRLLITFAGAAGLAVFEPALITALLAQYRPSTAYKTYPNGRDPNAPPDVEKRGNPDPQAIQRANQVELRKDIAKLYEMASDLKEQVEKADPSSALSLSLVKKAGQIEKLAKQIKGLAKG